MTQVLLEKGFPMTELRLLASERSAGRRISVGGRDLEVELATPDAFEGVDIALFSAGGGTSKQLAPEAAARGAAVIDNSSAWRMDPDVPLVVSQVNPDDLAWHEGIIANPNCSTMQLVPPLMALRDAVGLERIIVDTYQSVAGTGHKAIVELEEQVKAHAEGRPKVASRVPAPDRVQRPAAHRRVPGQRVHERGVEGRHREPEDPAPAGPAGLVHGGPRPGVRQPLGGGPRGDEPARSRRTRHARCSRASRASSCRTIPPRTNTRLAETAAGSDDVFVGRVRQDLSIDGNRGLAFWVVSDNLRKGAASNAVEIAEILVERGWVRRASDRGADAASSGASGRAAEREPVGASGGRTA